MVQIRTLKPDEIECRVAQVSSKGCSLLLYKTARVDRAILDETYGDLWQNDFKVIDGKMYGGIGIYNKELKDWLWRWDCGVESNTEAEKGQASDCFKRAGFKWGIGIELYSAPFIWLNLKTYRNELLSKKMNKDVYKLEDKFAKFYVNKIEYGTNKNIKNLVITNDKGEVVFSMKKQKTEAKPVTDDTYIYIELAKICDRALLKDFYNRYKEKVKDRKAFYSMVQDKLEALKNLEKEIL